MLVAVVDSQEIFGFCLSQCLQEHNKAIQFIVERSCLAIISGDVKPDIVLYVDRADGAKLDQTFRLLDSVKDRGESVKLIVLTDRCDSETVRDAIERGVAGYLTTRSSVNLLSQAIHLVVAGGTLVPPAVLQHAPEPGRRREDGKNSVETMSLQPFTAKEIEVLRELRQGKQNKLIAYELGICETTVKVHVRHIMKKVGARNRTQAALFAEHILPVSVFDMPPKSTADMEHYAERA